MGPQGSGLAHIFPGADAKHGLQLLGFVFRFLLTPAFISVSSPLQGWELLTGPVSPLVLTVPQLCPSVLPRVTTAPVCLPPALVWVPRAPSLSFVSYVGLKLSSVPSNSPHVPFVLSVTPRSLFASPLLQPVPFDLDHLAPWIPPVTLCPLRVNSALPGHPRTVGHG